MALNPLSFLFGSDPGARYRRDIGAFARTGLLPGGADPEKLMTAQIMELLGREGALQRSSLGQRLSRSGIPLTGSLAEDLFGNIGLGQSQALADAIRQARINILNMRLQALMGLAQQPRQPGLIETVAPAAAAALIAGL